MWHFARWKTAEKAKYLRQNGTKLKTIARFSCCNGEGNTYWVEDNKKTCRLCEKEKELWQHIESSEYDKNDNNQKKEEREFNGCLK